MKTKSEEVKNHKILWRNQHILEDLINLPFVENVNYKVIFSTMKLDMRAKEMVTICYVTMSFANVKISSNPTKSKQFGKRTFSW